MFPAGPAGSARPTGQQRMKDDGCSWRQVCAGIGFQDTRCDFVPWMDGIRRADRQFHAMKQMKISAANTTGEHLQPAPPGRPLLGRRFNHRHAAWRYGNPANLMIRCRSIHCGAPRLNRKRAVEQAGIDDISQYVDTKFAERLCFNGREIDNKKAISKFPGRRRKRIS